MPFSFAEGVRCVNPQKVVREKVKELLDLPNVGKASAGDLRLLGIHSPDQLIGKCPYTMYRELCRITQIVHDPCVIDVFMSVTDFMNGAPPLPWWDYTKARKQNVAEGKWSLLHSET